jgi:hypothetical protein
MTPRTRITLAFAALLLGLAYVAPLWHIGLDAPQYPEGIGMYVWINTITGQKPNDLHSINGLNHYIGMKAIVPDAIPELRLMPRIVAGRLVVGPCCSAGRRCLRSSQRSALLTSGIGVTTTATISIPPPQSRFPASAISRQFSAASSCSTSRRIHGRASGGGPSQSRLALPWRSASSSGAARCPAR